MSKISEQGQQGQGERCWALAVILTKRGECCSFTMRQIVGYRFAPDFDSALGSFVRAYQKENKGYEAGEVVTIEVLKRDLSPDVVAPEGISVSGGTPNESSVTSEGGGE